MESVKPVEWSEEDKSMNNDKCIRYGLKIILEYWNNLPNYLLDENKLCENLYNFLKSCLTPEQEMRSKIINRAASEKQVVLVTESDGNAEIGWDTRSLEDAKNLLEYGISFINKQLSEKNKSKKHKAK